MSNQGIVNIRGKNYKTVALRITEFREQFANLCLETEIITNNEERVIIKAIISNEAERVVATGFAEELRGSSNINKTSALENCETSAIGRALACLGLGGEEYASANEVSDALIKQAVDEATDVIKNHQKTVRDNFMLVNLIKDHLANDNMDAAINIFFKIDPDDRKVLLLAPTKGGIFTTKERNVICGDEFKKAWLELVKEGKEEADKAP